VVTIPPPSPGRVCGPQVALAELRAWWLPCQAPAQPLHDMATWGAECVSPLVAKVAQVILGILPGEHQLKQREEMQIPR
jgi:hypothetical protein